MCRIAGFVGNKATRKVATILRGLVVAEDRSNPHGTGIAVRTRDGKTQIMKKGIRGRSYLVRGCADFLWNARFNMALLHVRYMTSGEQSDRCSHPFGFRVKGQWHFGMHNGVFSDSLCTKMSEEFGCSKSKVDSETFFWALQALQNGGKSLEEAIQTLTAFIGNEGAYAFAYMTTDSVYLWRSEGRPLSAFDLRGENLGRWFCSTPEMFKKGLKIAGYDSLQYTGFDVKPFRLYRVGQKTSPAHEVEAVCDLPKPPPPPAPPKPPVTVSRESNPSLYHLWRDNDVPNDVPKGQLTLWEDDESDPDFPPEAEVDIEYEFPGDLGNSALNRKIAKVSAACEFGTLYSDYLCELLYEREMRKQGSVKKKGGQAHAKAYF